MKTLLPTRRIGLNSAKQFAAFNQISHYLYQLTEKIENLKIGILKEGFGLEISEPDVDKMVKEAAGQLSSKCGTVVEEVSIPMHSDGKLFASILSQKCYVAESSYFR